MLLSAQTLSPRVPNFPVPCSVLYPPAPAHSAGPALEKDLSYHPDIPALQLRMKSSCSVSFFVCLFPECQ